MAYPSDEWPLPQADRNRKALIVFVAQNTGGVEIGFLWMRGRVPLALALIVAGIAGVVIARAVTQLRRPARRR
jgi:uncharacterized integral membrane protein